MRETGLSRDRTPQHPHPELPLDSTRPRAENGTVMRRYPLLLGFRDIVPGPGFQARVRADGRALLREEEDGFWVDGVNPGGVAGGAATLEEALATFRETHLGFAHQYIARWMPDPRGTGGTPYQHWLGQLIAETRAHKIG